MSKKKQPTEYVAQVTSTYQTGSTSPPKSYVGIVTFLLSATIIICGISTIFSLMRINLLQKVIVQTENQECAMAFVKATEPIPGQFLQGQLQIQGEPLDAFWQSYHDLPQGIYVTQSCGQPLYTGDVIISLDHTPITDWETIDDLVAQHAPGDKIAATVYRNNKQLQLELTIYE